MLVTLHKIGQTEELNITGRLFAAQNFVITEWIGDEAFERLHGDVTLQLSDMDGVLRSIFGGFRKTDRWELFIRDDSSTVIWRGELQHDSIEFDIINESFTLTAFAKTKLFWERAKQIAPIVDDFRAWRDLEDVPGYLTIQRLFLALNERHNLWLNGTLFGAFDPGVFLNRRIRGVSYQSRPIGNEGKLDLLADDFTVADLLQAFQRYYMCEFYIEHSTGTLVMKRFRRPSGDTVIDIDGYILNDGASVKLSAMQKNYAAIYTPVFLLASEPEILATRHVLANGLPPNTYQWAITASYEQIGQLILDIVSHYTDTVVFNERYGRLQVDLLMPRQHELFNVRRLWRIYPDSTGRTVWTKIAEFGNTTDIVVTDSGQNLGSSYAAPFIGPYAGAWHIYNEETGQWDIIYNIGLPHLSPRPEGDILEIAPELRWKDSAVDARLYMWSLFGKERELGTLRDDWLSLLKTTRRARVETTQQFVPLFTRVRSAHFPNDLTQTTDYMIVKREDDVIAKKSVLELISL